MKVQQVFDWLDENPLDADQDSAVRAFVARARSIGVPEAFVRSLRADTPVSRQGRYRGVVASVLAKAWAAAGSYTIGEKTLRVAFHDTVWPGTVAVGSVRAYLNREMLEHIGVPALAAKAVEYRDATDWLDSARPWLEVRLYGAHNPLVESDRTGAEMMREDFVRAVRYAVEGNELLTAAGLAMLEEKGFIDFADVSAVIMRRLPWFNLED